MRKYIDETIFFDSSIPQGFGLGSSGALVAGVYDNYANKKIASEYKELFPRLETANTQMDFISKMFVLIQFNYYIIYNR